MSKKYLNQADDKMAFTLSCIGDGVITIDLDGKITFMNTAAEGLTGWGAEEAYGQDFQQVFVVIDYETGEPLESLMDSVARMDRVAGLKKDSALLLRDGRKKYISANCSPIRNARGENTGMVIVFRDITRIRQVEEQLKTERNNFKSIFEAAPMSMIIVDEQLIIKQVNPTFLRTIGRSEKEVVGRKLGEGLLCLYSFAKGCGNGGECQCCDLRNKVIQLFHTGKPCQGLIVKYPSRLPEKEVEPWYKVNLVPVALNGKTHIMIAIDDITELKSAEEGLNRYRLLSETARDIILFVERDGQIIDANEAAVKAYGYTRTELLNLTIFDLRKAKDLALKQMKQAEHKGIFFETTHYRKDGTSFPVEVSSQGAELEGKQILLSIIRDVTERKLAEQVLKEAKEEAEAASRAKSEFLANMSHEIRTPLNGIVGMINLTLSTDLNFEQKDNLATAKTCADSLLNIINDILDFSKMEAGRLVIEETNFSLRECLEEVIKTHSPRAVSKGLELNYTLSSTIPAFLVGDPYRLQQVLHNLVSNAIKFTEAGEITVSIKTIAHTPESAELKFAVSDTGIGIAQSDLGNLFQSFNQIDRSFTRKYGGTGLGLAISKQLVEMMGGTMGVVSEKDRGSTFYFLLKFKLGRPVPEEPKQRKVYRSNNPLHILLAEDDAINQKVISRMLQEGKHVVEVAGNGKEAIDLFHRRDFDLVLMDIQMPELDGIEATRRIREKEGSARHTPIVALTAYALQGDRERFLSMGMDEYIAKPIQMEELYYILEKISPAKDDPPKNLPHGVFIDDQGNIVFTKKSEFRMDQDMIPVLREILACIEELEPAFQKNDLEAVERIAHKIKVLSNRVNADEIKIMAFKIELAARRGTLIDIWNYVKLIKHEWDTFKKSTVLNGRGV